jgi:hypothetical protein
VRGYLLFCAIAGIRPGTGEAFVQQHVNTVFISR